MVYLKIRENNAQAKAIIMMLKAFDFVEFIKEKDLPNETTRKAIAEADKGKLKRYKTVSALMNDLKSE